MGVTACVTSLGAAPMFSQYGQIQNVQNYSTNPLYTPNSSYRYNMPSPVFSTGPTVSTSDCQYTVTDLINNYCLGLNNCAGLDANDIRPSIMLQLSYMQNGNYSTACAGYIDELFNKYISQHPNTKTVSVPMQSDTASVPQSTIANPYQNNAPTWAQDMQKRQQELQNLRKPDDNMYTQGVLYSFPSSSADLSREEKIANLTHGYEPFKDARAYREMDIRRDEILVTVTPPPPVDVCLVPNGATTIDENMDRIYSFYDDDRIKDFLMSHVSNEPYTWGAAFPYGIILGKATKGELINYADESEVTCGCQITKYYANDGKVYTGFKPGESYVRTGFRDSIRAYNYYSNLPDSYYSNCAGNCLYDLVSNMDRREKFFGTVFPHTSTETCEPDKEYILHFDIGEDNPGYFEHGEVSNDLGTAKRISDEFLYDHTTVQCYKDHNGQAHSFTSAGDITKAACPGGGLEPGWWMLMFTYGAWFGGSYCEDDGQCSCEFKMLPVFKIGSRNPELPSDIDSDWLMMYYPAADSPFPKVPLMTFGSVDACKEKCSEQCAFAVGQAGNANVEFRKKLIPKDKELTLYDKRQAVTTN